MAVKQLHSPEDLARIVEVAEGKDDGTQPIILLIYE